MLWQNVALVKAIELELNLVVHLTFLPAHTFTDELHIKHVMESMDHTCVGISYSSELLFFPPLRVDKKRDKIERKILDSQERAFWDVHRPVVSEITDVVFIITFAVIDIIADIIKGILIVAAKVEKLKK